MHLKNPAVVHAEPDIDMDRMDFAIAVGFGVNRSRIRYRNSDPLSLGKGFLDIVVLARRGLLTVAGCHGSD